jgi:hypothetical protein
MSNKLELLHNFINKYKYLPIQGSAEWLKSRSETIGGSEISTILGLNPYQNVKQLIKQKIGLTTFKKAPPLWFGNIFEYILQQYTEYIFDTKIYETGSIPYEKSNLIKYSPDGLSVINKKYLNNIISTDFLNSINDKELLILFEFKNPYMRVLKKDQIPIYYINQPRLGMEVIDISEVSIFIEAVFRFCSINDIIKLNNKYNCKYHYDKIRYTNIPLAFGAFSLYYEKNNSNDNLINLLNDLNHYLYNHSSDFENLSDISDKHIINKIMENIIDYKDLKIVYHDICINHDFNNNEDLYHFNKYNNIHKFINNINNTRNQILENSNNEYLGYFAYKMFDINIQPIYKTNIINESLLNKINIIIETIKKCNNLTDLDQKKKIIDTFSI